LSFSDLPLLNAILNSTSTGFILAGYYFIRKKNRVAHQRCMTIAVTTSLAFLLSYVVYHFEVGSVGFKGEGGIRTVYFTILISHTLLAFTLPILVPITFLRGLKKNFSAHKKVARFTLPIWLYVSFTGVLVYLFLYQLPV
jgi:uncharacterized membrane protein YozB (DUF420 family)